MVAAVLVGGAHSCVLVGRLGKSCGSAVVTPVLGAVAVGFLTALTIVADAVAEEQSGT